ncbi:MAG: hypothetical protein AAB581_03375 [Patescibacteria group bacterium]
MGPDDFPQNIPSEPQKRFEEDVLQEEQDSEIMPEPEATVRERQDTEQKSEAVAQEPENVEADVVPETVMSQGQGEQIPKQELEEGAERKQEQEIVVERQKVQDFIDAGRKLVRALRAREEERLNSLIDESNVMLLVRSLDNVQELLMDNQPTVDKAEFERALEKTVDALRSIGDVPREHSMRDNEESLGRIASYLRNVGDTAHDIALSLAREKDGRLERALHILDALKGAADDGRLFVNKKRNQLEQYRR